MDEQGQLREWKNLREYNLHFELGDLKDSDVKKIKKYINKFPFYLKSQKDLELQVTAEDSKTFSRKSNKIIKITPRNGKIESICDTIPNLSCQALYYRLLILTQDKTIIFCNRLDREIHLDYSNQTSEIKL